MIRYSVKRPRPQTAVGTEPFHRYTFDDGTVWTEFYRLDTGYLLRFPDLADFKVSADGEAVTAYPAKDTDEATVEHLYINQLVPLALSRQGRPAFHASVVTVDSGAVAFLGKTGTGKSTLAASFALHGTSFLTDDALIIEERDGECCALPSHPSVRLWDDSVEALIGGREQARSHITYSDKTRLLAGDALVYSDGALPLLAAYVLEGNEPPEVAIRPVDGSARHMVWIENSFLLDIDDRDLLAQHFDWTHRISSKVPTFALDYVRDYGMLPEVRRAIRAHAGELQ